MRWKRIGIGAAVVAGVLLVGGLVAQQLLAAQARRMFTQLATEDPHLYPERMVVCRGATTVACANEAARRVGRPVAWLAESTDVHPRVLVATPVRGWANQDSRIGKTMIVSLSSPWQGQPRGRLVQTVQERGDTLQVFEAPVDGRDMDVELRWRHGGSAFRMGGVEIDPWAPPLTPERLIELWRQVRYGAAPRSVR